MITKAVILAAGMGRRLQGASDDRPKGFLTLGEQAIIVESLLMLRAHGITEVCIGTGYRREQYEALSRDFAGLSFVDNEAYASTGSMATLRRMRDLVGTDFLLLESDIIYERSALRRIIDIPVADAVLASDVTSYGDEVYIEATGEARLAGMSKDPAAVSRVDSILVGISKLSAGTLRRMCDYFDAQGDPTMNYEDAMVEVSRQSAVTVCHAGPLLWCEIDTPEHLEIARRFVYPAIRGRDDLPAVPRNVLLNPGPATTTDSVKYAQVVPDICPREQEFGQMLADSCERITELVANPAQYVTVMFGGSGTAAVEAMVSSVVGEDHLLCVVNNGAYGARMSEMGRIYRLSMTEYQGDPLNGVDAARLAAQIDATPRRVTHLAVVHHETTTGVLNDLAAIGQVCAARGIVLMVDAISSFAAVPIDMAAQGISYLAATANKNLQGMPGVSFVVARRAALEGIATLPPRNLYLNLYQQYRYFAATLQTRFTPPVQACYALRQALIETRLEGVERRYQRYSACWEVLMAGLNRLGLATVVPLQHQSRLLTTIAEPAHPSYDFDVMHDTLKRRGFTVYPGKLDGRKTFRIANIGAIFPADMAAFLAVLEEYLCSLPTHGAHGVPPGAGQGAPGAA